MAQTKKKIEPVKSTKKGGTRREGVTTSNVTLEATLKDSKFWEAEIADLAKQEHTSIRAALEALVDKVLKRYPPQQDQLELTRSFLLDLLESDPTIEETLRKNLNIRHHVPER